MVQHPRRLFTLVAVRTSNLTEARCVFLEIRTEFGHTMAQAVSRRLLTADARLDARVITCGICCGQSGSGTGFSRSYRFSPVSIIPLCLSILVYHLADEK
jgi:hypothetical protein